MKQPIMLLISELDGIFDGNISEMKNKISNISINNLHGNFINIYALFERMLESNCKNYLL